jgi:magnesium chelatase subunit D
MFNAPALTQDQELAAALFAVDPHGLGGVVLRGGAGPLRDAWLARLREWLPASAPIKRIPLHISDERLLGGLDLAATLKTGKPVLQRGVLAQADGGVAVLAMAERVTAHTAARVCAVLDKGEVSVQRDGLALTQAARIGLVALDEGLEDENGQMQERMAPALQERLALLINIDTANRSTPEAAIYACNQHYTYNSISVEEVTAARSILGAVIVDDEIVESLCAAALALGVGSLRAAVFALNAARAAAALRGDTQANEQDAALAAKLVLGHRATQLPQAAADEDNDQDNDEAKDDDDEEANDADKSNEDDQKDDAEQAPPPIPSDQDLKDIVLEAAKAAIPAGLLAQLQALAASNARAQSAASGRAGALRNSKLRGRPIGARRGELKAGARLNVIETLRAAAPWQKIRQAEIDKTSAQKNLPKCIHIRREDFHITRLKQRSETTTVFVVDASGSAALQRLGEAKGAVELLLADCYIRRDRVALLAFRGVKAELLLPPTRSLVRAKRSLAALPGGGGTPLASAIDSARDLSENLQRQGVTPVLVFLTDGKGNIARDGTPGRALATEQALAAAQSLRGTAAQSLLLDTSREPQEQAQQLAAAMGAQYLPLPYADSKVMSRAVRAALVVT